MTTLTEEDVLEIIRRHPEVIVEALSAKPELLLGIISRILPWDKLATKDDIRMLLEFLEKRFEDINRRFEDINRRFEDVNRRFEDINKRFEDMRFYIDRRIGFLEKLILAFNIPILITVVTIAIKLLLG